MTRRSQASASSQPPPKAMPRTAPTTGTGAKRRARMVSEPSRMRPRTRSASPDAAALAMVDRSAPALNARASSLPITSASISSASAACSTQARRNASPVVGRELSGVWRSMMPIPRPLASTRCKVPASCSSTAVAPAARSPASVNTPGRSGSSTGLPVEESTWPAAG